jgi:OOP family OmpA-OmpF porin
MTQLAVPAPIEVAVAPPPPATPPALARITLDADALFDFDKAMLRPAGQLALDDFVGKIKEIHAEMITAYGYTDRFGTDNYNQHLSEQRVGAVRSYLEGKGIAPNNLHTEGRGNTQPVTKPGECEGGENAKVIACLQPDRRVEVEVAGTPVVL